jgi:hypothetical protein
MAINYLFDKIRFLLFISFLAFVLIIKIIIILIPYTFWLWYNKKDVIAGLKQMYIDPACLDNMGRR